MKKKNVAIIFPAFNEAPVIEKTLRSVRKILNKNKNYNHTFIVIDDGSTDNTKRKSKKEADVLLHHRINRGLGASLATGMEYVRRKNIYDYAITFDSDGQHNPKDIDKTIQKLEEDFEVVIGSRFLENIQQFPKMRKMVLQASNIITFIFFGIKTTDSQSGFRGFSKHAINKIRLSTNRMEVSSEFFAEIKRHKLRYGEIPITVEYSDYSMKKGQSNLNGIKILVKLLYKVF